MKGQIKLDLPFFQQWVEKIDGRLTGYVDNLKLYSAYQPIFSLAHKRIVGYEALLRARKTDGSWTSPAPLFEQKKSTFDLIFLDRLSRYIHVHNFNVLADPINWLFLNVSLKTIINGKAYGEYFKELLTACNIPAHRVVIEVVEQPIEDNALLLDTINFYKNMDCLIAIDDFGAGYSNFDRIWMLKPDIVKLDRSFLLRASGQESIRNLLPGIIALLHQAGALVLIEGVETRQEAIIAMESGADFVQGYYFGRPFIDLSSGPDKFDGFESLFKQHKRTASHDEALFRRKTERYTVLFKKAIAGLRAGQPFEKSVERLLAEPYIVRCYQIGTDGIQIGHTAVSESYKTHKDNRFLPLDDAKNADWFRRHYLKRAIRHPGQLQLSRPYLSITGAHMCVTMSMKFKKQAQESVLCIDIVI